MADEPNVKPYVPLGTSSTGQDPGEPVLAPPGEWKGNVNAPKPKDRTFLEAADDVAGGIGKGVRDAAIAAPGALTGSAVRTGEWIGDRLRTGARNLTGSDPAIVGDAVRDALGNPEWLGPHRAVKDFKPASIDEVGKTIRDQRTAARKSRGDDDDWTNVGPVSLPTTAGMLKRAKEVGIPDYEPKSNWGKAPQKVAGLGTAIAMGPGSAAQKAMMTLEGVGGGFAGDWIQQHLMPSGADKVGRYFGMTPDEMSHAGEAIGTGLGMADGARTMRGFTSKEDIANRGLGNAALEDQRFFEMNPRQAPLMTNEEIMRARELGVDVPNWAIMGPNQRRLIQESAKTPEDIAKVQDMNRQIGAAGVDDVVTNQRPVTPVIRWLEDTFGGHLDAGEMWLALRDQMKATNNANYKALSELPHAQNVWSDRLATLYGTPRMRPIMERAAVLAAEDGNPIRAPIWQEPQGSIRTLNHATQAFEESPAIPGGWKVDPNAPPNIDFHNYVRKALNDEIDGQVAANGYRHNESTKSLKRVRDEITGEAEKIVPEWGQVRSKAADLFGKEDALDFGPEVWKKGDTFTNAELKDAFRSMSQDEQAMAQYSLGTVLRDNLNTNLAGTIKKITQQREKLGEVLGQDYIENLLLEGKAAMQRAKATGVDVAPYQPSIMEKAKHVAKLAATPAAWTAPAMAQMGEAMLGAQPWAHMIMPTVHGVSGIAPFTLAPLLTRSVVRNAIARPMLRGARGKIIEHYANPESPLRLPDQAARPQRVAPMPADPDAPGSLAGVIPHRAKGGEIGPRPRGKINVDSAASALVKQVEQARAELSGETQNILAHPDTNVVHALSIAKNALG